jgi:hypothetical protein
MGGIIMALPIAATPVLTGDDAVRFYKELEESAQKTVSDEEIERGIRVFRGVMAKSPHMKRFYGME